MIKKNWKNLFEYYQFTKKDERDYPVVSRILKQLTPERIKKEVERVKKVELPSELKKWVEEYDEVGKRDGYIWKWLYSVNKILVYPSIKLKYHHSQPIIKTLCSMFIILLDDVSVRSGSEELLNKLLNNIIFRINNEKNSQLSIEEQRYLRFTRKVWYFIEGTLSQYPNYSKIKNVFNYDIEQLLNTIRYTHLIDKNLYLINVAEFWFYFTYKMQIMLNFDLDLMCYENNFDFKNLGKKREIILCLQDVARISNWLTTWEREIRENDFTSIIFAHALERKIIGIKDLENKYKMIKKIKKARLEVFLLKKEWENHYKNLHRLSKKVGSKNNGEVLEKARYLLFMHLIGQGDI